MPSPTRYHVGDLEIDTACYAVFRTGRPVPLEPKAVTLLIFLVEHRARVVSKDELTELLWKDTFVTPNALTRLVAQLRRELGDAAQEPRLIQTVHRRGYRFIAAIEDAAATVPATIAFPPAASQSRPAPGKYCGRRSTNVVRAA